ncbi:MAG: tetratricopeptide repeat protein, partial [Bacteriovoracaceae bacterium]
QKRQQDEIEKRESMFRQVLEIDPEDTLANYGLGEIEYLKENYAKSIAHLQTAISSQKNYSVAWLQLAKSFIALRREEEAKATLQEGIAIAGKNGDLMPANEMQRLLSELK